MYLQRNQTKSCEMGKKGMPGICTFGKPTLNKQARFNFSWKGKKIPPGYPRTNLMPLTDNKHQDQHVELFSCQQA